MSRFVVPQREGLVAGGAEPPSSPAERIVKYVPAEVVSVFTIVIGALASASMAAATAQLVGLGMLLFFLVVTIAYVISRAPKGSVRNAHLIVTSFAFVAWSYPISRALLGNWFIGWIAAVGQAIFLGLALVIAPSEPKTL